MISTCRIDVGQKISYSLSYLIYKGFIQYTGGRDRSTTVLNLRYKTTIKPILYSILKCLYNSIHSFVQNTPVRKINDSWQKCTCRKSCRINQNILKFIGGECGVV